MGYNFSAGPATIYSEVLTQIHNDFLDYKGIGYSIIEASHRTSFYDKIHNDAIEQFKTLLKLGDDYHVVLLGGGATLQYAMLAYNFLSEGQVAQYINSGYWATAAIQNAKKTVKNDKNIEVVWDGSSNNFTRLPQEKELVIHEKSAYLHLTSNETIGGIQWKQFPNFGKVNVVADMCSDILSRTIDANAFSLIYAGTQKNLGISGVTVIAIKNSFLEKANNHLPDYLSYKKQVEKNSLLNTPPVFSVWVFERVLNHIIQLGGIEALDILNAKKADLIYQYLQECNGFYNSPIDFRYRSNMNVVFTLPSVELQNAFLVAAENANLTGLKGHRSVGGCRASIYNAMPIEGVEVLIEFMKHFKNTH